MFDNSTVTRAEFSHVHVGQTRRHVENVFDTHGQLVFGVVYGDGSKDVRRTYQTNDGHMVLVDYHRNAGRHYARLVDKSWQ